MDQNLIARLLEGTASKPFSRATIKKLFDRIEQNFFHEIKSGKISPDQLSSFINNEIFEFAETLEDDERDLFMEFIMIEAASREEPKEDGSLVKHMDPDADQWNFYIRFKISRPLGVDHESISFLEGVSIESDSELPLKHSITLKLKNSKTSIYREIIEIAKKTEQALKIAFSEMGIGIAYPDDLASETVQEKIKKEIEICFLNHHTTYHEDYYDRPLIHFSDKYGVILFQEADASWDSKATEDRSPVDTKKLSELFDKSYKKLGPIWFLGDRFKKIDKATAILTTSLFDESLINRIILSMTTIEVLSEKTLRPSNEIEALDYLIDHLKISDLDDSIKASLQKSLDVTKHQSIGKSCKLLIKNLLGKKESENFYRLYEARSQLVHAGGLKDVKEEMYKTYTESYELARKTLEAYIEDAAIKTIHD